jgi:DNA-binding transcriptional LysR family regulator
MELRQLRTFRAAATFLNFSRAAARLHYAQSSVSAQIQALEEELGVSLFDRLGRGIRLTEAGERLLQYAQKILDLTEETRTEVVAAREIAGCLTIRIPESVGAYRLAPVIATYTSLHPKVRLCFTTCAHETLQKDLRKGVTDLAFLLAESFQDSELESEILGLESIVLVAGPSHHLASRDLLRTKDLDGETVLLSSADCSYRRTFERLLGDADAEPGQVHTFSSVQALRRCVMDGAGITVLPRVAVEEALASGALRLLNWEEGSLEVALLLIRYSERWLSPAQRAFIAVTREVLGNSRPRD